MTEIIAGVRTRDSAMAHAAAHRDHVCARHSREATTSRTASSRSADGKVKADVLALKDPNYKRMNFCSIILGSIDVIRSTCRLRLRSPHSMFPAGFDVTSRPRGWCP